MKRWMLLVWLPFLLGSGNERPTGLALNTTAHDPLCALATEDCRDGIP
ncbi:hypothetical protein [Rhodothermus profundi]|uniref:Uncharacterized protein n=1 Tax=Rhodothermus profundi TaxID=633813 RepID=A0A1M6SSZ3_9BACT|nr:hypothetical protein [Rhodothermus profundi]SHK47750.1 hypothetical protein SAMN04488087_1212 [Rhodothermus profundi]